MAPRPWKNRPRSRKMKEEYINDSCCISPLYVSSHFGRKGDGDWSDMGHWPIKKKNSFLNFEILEKKRKKPLNRSVNCYSANRTATVSCSALPTSNLVTINSNMLFSLLPRRDKIYLLFCFFPLSDYSSMIRKRKKNIDSFVDDIIRVLFFSSNYNQTIL